MTWYSEFSDSILIKMKLQLNDCDGEEDKLLTS